MPEFFPEGYKLVSIKPDTRQIHELRKALGFNTDHPTKDEQDIIVAMVQAYSIMVEASYDYEIQVAVNFTSEKAVDKVFFDPLAWTEYEMNKDNDQST